MRKHLIIVTIAALGALVCSCEREKDINTPGEIGKNTLAFTLKTSGAETRSMDTAPAVQRGAIIPLETTEDGLSFFLEETIASLDDETFFVPVETIGTPVYTENFETMSGGSFRGAGFLDQQMTNGKITNAVYPNGGWADFTKKNEFWEHSYDWDPWYDRDALLFYGALFTEDPSPIQTQTGVLTNSLTFLNNATDGQSLTFSYRSAPTAQDQQDILFAARKITKQEAKKAVPILFYHALTGVKFATAYKNDGAVKTYIKKVELTGLYGYGKCKITSTEEDGGYSDVTSNHSSARAVTWDLTVSGASASLKNVYYQEYSNQNIVTYEGSSFGSKGDYPASFNQAGYKNNLNDTDATMTFWFPAQQMSEGVILTVTYEIEFNGKKKEFTNTLELGKALLAQSSGKNVTWAAGQIRTFTLKPDQVDVTITDKVNGFIKDNVVITNSGNVDAYIRAHIDANWWGTTLDGHDGIALGYVSNADNTAPVEPLQYVKAWKMDDSAGAPYYGEFTGLPGAGWILAKDGYYYYKDPVAPGEPTGTALFEQFKWVESEHPVPVIWYLSNAKGLQKFDKVRLIMDIPVQAIEAKTDFANYIEAWADAGVTVVPAE